MSGIFGMMSTAGAGASAEALEPMLEPMRVWGQAQPTVVSTGAVALGYVADRGLPHSGNQPVTLPEAPDVTLVADVRLDEPVRLQSALGLPAATTPSDAELVLHAYLRWGEFCFDRVYGAFALAISDARRHLLILARDHIGLRPLHYWRGPDKLLFATGAEAIVAHPHVPELPDETALAARLVGHYGVLLERSAYAGVSKVRPGHVAVARSDRITDSRYWFPERITEQRLSSPVEYVEALREGLLRAAQIAVRGDGAIGAHVSGGLDSSAVAALANRVLREEGRQVTRVFSWSPPPDGPADPTDERTRVAEVARALGAPATYCDLNPEHFEADFERDLVTAPNEALLYETQVLRDAETFGIDVILSGWGGDEVASFSGGGRTGELLRTMRWRTLIREAASPSRREGVGLVRTAWRTLRTIVNTGVGTMLPEPVAHGLRLQPRWSADQALVKHGDRVHPEVPGLMRAACSRMRPRPSMHATRLAYLRNGHITARIEAWAAAAARLGVEYRYPLLNRALLELCLSFPAELWRLHGQERWIIRSAVEPFLPASVLPDPKAEPVRLESFFDVVLSLPSPPPDPSLPTPVTFARAQRRRVHAMAEEARRRAS